MKLKRYRTFIVMVFDEKGVLAMTYRVAAESKPRAEEKVREHYRFPINLRISEFDSFTVWE